MSKISGIQGQVLQVTVVSGKKLRDTEMFTEQDPYVCLEYANSRLRTRTCKDGGRNPVFGEKFQIPLVEGLTDLNIVVWNSNTLRQDDFIGSGRVQLEKVLLQGYDDSSWPIQTRNLKPAGQVQLVMQISGTSKKQKPSASAPHAAPPASPYGPPPPPLGYPPVAVNIYPGAGHPPPGAPYQPYGQPYAPPPAGYYYPPPAGSYPGNYPPHC
ncbi:Calcium-dependent lipid-binding (CaLB domain) family protein [Rhynchospora pubera]|uniref:Calcium-dependent lipid-binding (CaLB domain) family protein n=1 Tax=Rhynchospora pubera TaxID=906938 RepID=A0AAV8H0R9_9POAL|nr:Calcium-dependent lipid-binding (CaLB domain) family protein [Rhynchospora pubera]